MRLRFLGNRHLRQTALLSHLSFRVCTCVYQDGKEQNLSLNQTKISGVCGRLMCCLKNEQETYEALNKSLPGTGDTVTLPDGLQGIVHSVNVLRQRVKVIVEVNDEKEIQEYPVGELKFRSRKKKAKNTDKETRDIE